MESVRGIGRGIGTPRAGVTTHLGGVPHSGFIVLYVPPDIPLPDDQAPGGSPYMTALSQLLAQLGLPTVQPLIQSVPPQALLDLEAHAGQSGLPPRRSLTRFLRVDVRAHPFQAEAILHAIQALDERVDAYLEGRAVVAAVTPADEPNAGLQTHLSAAPVGVGAVWAWTQNHGDGDLVSLVDVEAGWFLDHEDLPTNGSSLLSGMLSTAVGDLHHGTAALGAAAARDNAKGGLGVAPNAKSVRVIAIDRGGTTGINVADALMSALHSAAPPMEVGDILLIEVQKEKAIPPAFDEVQLPVEVDQGEYTVIRLLSALGIVVIEPAGNGSYDLGTLYLSGATPADLILNPTSDKYQESGAIMVGACTADGTHNRWKASGSTHGSNYGERVNCHGQGEGVVTAGYGDLTPLVLDDKKKYTKTFNGTSSASAIIAGVAVVVQSLHQHTTTTRVSPMQMRAWLSAVALGTPQGTGVPGHIGPMPNLQALATMGMGLIPDVYVRDVVGDDGVVPTSGILSASPDIIVLPTAVANPQMAYGEGSGTENTVGISKPLAANHDHFLYIRVRNRGMLPASNVKATVHWSEPSTLVLPHMWTPIGTSAAFSVPHGDLTVAPQINWAAVDVPPPGHYCFIAVLDSPTDPAPALPVPLALGGAAVPMAWTDYLNLIGNQNNVAWCNFNVIPPPSPPLPSPPFPPVPSPGPPRDRLPFQLAGAPDKEAYFDLELVRRMPHDVDVTLEIPEDLWPRLQQAWTFSAPAASGSATVQLKLPMLPRTLLRHVLLPRAARYPCVFHLRNLKDLPAGLHSLSIQQSYEQISVGGITWKFQ